MFLFHIGLARRKHSETSVLLPSACTAVALTGTLCGTLVLQLEIAKTCAIDPKVHSIIFGLRG